ncbi:phenylalanine tRNA synthetase, alpha subunit [uncultured delta proteobacterium]|uniref:Phenylalanine--tRNA ligase alpha subunit n=1 Tax=uncultured delta proteobacterium TaxID=34034 RepID=A0A212JZB6_9DELT|nr:phenylalanine tRNA synthetase, alpha subunit [uncultured delta proteobacterium]
MNLIAALESLVPELENGLGQASNVAELEELRVDFLGRKGRLAQIMSQLPSLAPEERPAVGQKANEVKERCNALFSAKKDTIENAAETAKLSRFDPTLPGRLPWQGSLHPITQVMGEICDVLQGLGYEVVDGFEVETDFHNFEALNLPKEHPARDMQDTFYVTDSVVLRTHTSPMQVRAMLERKKPPLAIIAPGKVYRRDSDITHSPMFHQIEGLYVDKNVTFRDLRGTLTMFVRQLFGSEMNVRFRPSFFPFTEPSVEVDISCIICGGKGHTADGPCRVCKTTGWVEVLGCGMVDPNVFKAVGYDPEVTGFAFGLGVERMAMLKYGIGDLRLFFQNNVQFLQQFV